MRFKDIQRELCIRPGDSPEETLKSALLQETGYVTASTLQKQMGKNSSFNPLSKTPSRSNKNQHYRFKRKKFSKTEYLEPKTTKILMIQEETGNPNHVIFWKQLLTKPSPIMPSEKCYLQIMRQEGTLHQSVQLSKERRQH